MQMQHLHERAPHCAACPITIGPEYCRICQNRGLVVSLELSRPVHREYSQVNPQSVRHHDDGICILACVLACVNSSAATHPVLSE
eukprot:m.52829 g.52829  ORF g.52829 m.52829 type:complete len:85 (+) comp13524_c0_seq8:860-1114(+)